MKTFGTYPVHTSMYILVQTSTRYVLKSSRKDWLFRVTFKRLMLLNCLQDVVTLINVFISDAEVGRGRVLSDEFARRSVSVIVLSATAEVAAND